MSVWEAANAVMTGTRWSHVWSLSTPLWPLSGWNRWCGHSEEPSFLKLWRMSLQSFGALLIKVYSYKRRTSLSTFSPYCPKLQQMHESCSTSVGQVYRAICYRSIPLCRVKYGGDRSVLAVTFGSVRVPGWFFLSILVKLTLPLLNHTSWLASAFPQLMLVSHEMRSWRETYESRQTERKIRG